MEMNGGDFEAALSMLLAQSELLTGTPGSSKGIGAHGVGAPSAALPPQPPAPPPPSVLGDLAAGISSSKPALDALAVIVGKLARNARDHSVSVLHLSGVNTCLKQHALVPNFLQEIGYKASSDFWVYSRPDPAVLVLAQQAIDRARSSDEYQVAAAVTLSSSEADSRTAETIAAMRQRPPVHEPVIGEEAVTRLAFHFNGEARAALERRFAPDDALSDVVHYLVTLEDSRVPPSSSWELVESASPPFWWCHGWEVSDITVAPPRVFDLEDGRRTLQSLELWPSAQISVQRRRGAGVTGGTTQQGNAAGVSSSTSAAASSPARAVGSRLGGKLKPSELLGKVSHRFDNKTPLGGARKHFNVSGTATAAGPGAPSPPSTTAHQASVVAELMAMGFPETRVRAALKRVNGNKERAIELLLR
uniref:UBA domain-containing protein n=1 Tax=Rhizochromulina marina TaxID=1034831 RepID=A0A7S2RT17_9STRA